MDIEKEIADIIEKQNCVFALMQKSAAQLSDELNQGVSSDVKKHLNELGKLIEIYDNNAAEKTALLYAKEQEFMFNNLRYIRNEST